MRRNWLANTPKGREYARTRNAADRLKHLRRAYGLTERAVQTMKEAQGFACAICGQEPTRWCIDHDHQTGKVRGLLCHKCNAGLGLLQDSPVLLRAALRYLHNAA